MQAAACPTLTCWASWAKARSARSCTCGGGETVRASERKRSAPSLLQASERASERTRALLQTLALKRARHATRACFRPTLHGSRAHARVAGAEFALKVMNKQHLVREGQTLAAKAERDLLDRSQRHAGVVRFHFTFQDATNLFMALEMCHLDLFSLVHHRRARGGGLRHGRRASLAVSVRGTLATPPRAQGLPAARRSCLLRG